MLKIFIFLFIVLLSSGCKKDNFNPVKVTYKVKAADSSLLRITYNSDYYYDSGNRTIISHLSNGNTWTASHIANKPEEYYIKAEYISSVNPEKDFRVMVILADTLGIDSLISDTIVHTVELTGSIR